MKVLELLDYLEQTINMSPKSLMGKVSINKKEVTKTLSEMRRLLPDEFEEAQNLMKRRDSIIGDAHREAERIVEDGRERAREEYDNCDILLQAKAEAQKILEEANSEANRIKAETSKQVKEMRFGVMNYADNTLNKLQKDIDITGETTLKELQKEMEEMLVKMYKQISTTTSKIREDIKELDEN